MFEFLNCICIHDRNEYNADFKNVNRHPQMIKVAKLTALMVSPTTKIDLRRTLGISKM